MPATTTQVPSRTSRWPFRPCPAGRRSPLHPGDRAAAVSTPWTQLLELRQGSDRRRPDRQHREGVRGGLRLRAGGQARDRHPDLHPGDGRTGPVGQLSADGQAVAPVSWSLGGADADGQPPADAALPVSVRVTNEDDPGEVTLISSPPRVGTPLTAVLTDPDGAHPGGRVALAAPGPGYGRPPCPRGAIRG